MFLHLSNRIYLERHQAHLNASAKQVPGLKVAARIS